MRVTHVISGLEAGGAEGFLARLAPALAPEVTSTIVSLRDDGVHGERLRSEGIEVVTIGLGRGRRDPRSLLRLAGALRRSRPDLVQTWLYHGDVIGGTVARSLGRPVLWNVRQTLVREGRQPHAGLIRAGARLSRLVPRAIVAVSTSARDDHVAAGYRADRFRVIPNGFDLDRFVPDAGAASEVRAELGLGPEARLVGMVARHDPQKDHATAFAALAQLLVTHPEVHLVLCGKDVDEANGPLTEAIRQAGVADRCLLLGQRTDLPRLQAAWDVAWSTSSYGEGLNNAIGEAMACGVPAVVTDVGDTAAMVGDAGAVVPPGRPEAMAAALAEVLDRSTEARRALGARARRRIADGYSLDRAAGAYVALYEEVLGRGR